MLHRPTFSFRSPKTQFERREYNGEDELYEVVDKISTGLSIEMIDTIFVDFMNRLQPLIDGRGDYVSYSAGEKPSNMAKLSNITFLMFIPSALSKHDHDHGI
jgi:hypothetical protein